MRRGEGEEVTAGLEVTFSSSALITRRLCNKECEVEHTQSACSPPDRSWSMPHVCPSGQALDTALIQTWRGLVGIQRCTPVFTAQSGWEVGSCLAFMCCSAFLTPLQDTLDPDGMKTLAWVSLLLSTGGTAEPYVKISN